MGSFGFDKSHENMTFMIYDISCKSLIGWKPLRIRFDRVVGLIRVYDGKIKIDLYDSLPLEKKLTLHNVIILIKSVFNKEQNHYYYNKFLEKYSNQLTKKQLQ